MKLKYPLAAIAAAFVLAGCDQSKQAGRAGSESSADINTPPAQVQQEAEKKDIANVPPMPEQKDIAKKEVTDTPPVPEPQEIVKQQIKEPADTTKPEPYPTENRDEFAASMQQKLTDLDQQLAELSDTIVSLNTDEAAQATLNSLQEHRAQLGTLLDELNKASPEAWDDAKSAFESSLAEFEKAYQEAKDTYTG